MQILTCYLFFRTLYQYTDQVSTQIDFRSLCAARSSKRSHVCLCCIYPTTILSYQFYCTYRLKSFSVLYLAKNSPSKKRRAGAGPVKKPAGSGPSLLNQTSSSSNAQSPFLQRQCSSDTREDVEGDKCENERTPNCGKQMMFNHSKHLLSLHVAVWGALLFSAHQ